MKDSFDANINTSGFWDDVYADTEKIKWYHKQGTNYMMSIRPFLGLNEDYQGTLLDFGCGMGAGVTVLRKAFPNAKIIGVDHSPMGIKYCQKNYGDIADFLCAEAADVPKAEIMISSHVMEHLTDDKAIVKNLLKKCSKLYIAVPYQEDNLKQNDEHLRSYDKKYYADIQGFVEAQLAWPRKSAFHMCLRVMKNVKNFIIGRRRRNLLGKHIIFIFDGSVS